MGISQSEILFHFSYIAYLFIKESYFCIPFLFPSALYVYSPKLVP